MTIKSQPLTVWDLYIGRTLIDWQSFEGLRSMPTTGTTQPDLTAAGSGARDRAVTRDDRHARFAKAGPVRAGSHGS